MTNAITVRLRQLALALSLGACAWTQGLAATDLANAPLSSTQANAKPNLLFILDDSGSMALRYMPDELGNMQYTTSTYGYLSTQCNGLAYNPSTTYKPPLTPASSTTAEARFASRLASDVAWLVSTTVTRKETLETWP